MNRLKIDLAVQTIIIVPLVLFFLGTLFTGGIEHFGFVALYAAAFLGPWQLIGSLMTTLSKGPFLRQRRFHMVTSLVYLVVISLMAALQPRIYNKIIEWIYLLIGFGVPTVLALYYYNVTLKSYRLAKAEQI